jgi:hypothetical protein
VQFDFVIVDWAAYGAGLAQQKDWLEWAREAPRLPSPLTETVPPLTEMAPMMRRRVDRLGRLACQVAYWCQSQGSGEVPMVFASRYGDAGRSLNLLGDLVQDEALSPTGFGLSVHNAISALYSIARADTGNTVVVAAGRATVLAALTEAAGLLADGAPEVLVVYYEAPLPAPYDSFEDEPAIEYAWAWRVARPSGSPDQVRVARVNVGAADDVDLDRTWPAGLSVLRHMLRQTQNEGDAMPAESWTRSDRVGSQWTWGTAHA